MICVIQRVTNGSVSVENNIISEIKTGYVILVGIEKNDVEKDLVWCAEKIVNMRIFEDNNGKLNLSIKDLSGDILCVSQFTLTANMQKGNRPSFDNAMEPENARVLYEKFKLLIEQKYKKPFDGQFQANMLVSINNNGPLTIILDSKKRIYN